MRRLLLMFLGFSAFATQADLYAQARLVQPADLFELERIGLIAWSPARSRAAVEVHRPSRPYNSYVLPRREGGHWVYFLPARTDARTFPHGADVRYHIAENGRDIVERHRMHLSMVNMAAPPNAVSGAHTVVTEDLPQDSDVFLVLRRTPRLPEVIMTQNHLYQIDIDGSITRRSKH